MHHISVSDSCWVHVMQDKVEAQVDISCSCLKAVVHTVGGPHQDHIYDKPSMT